MLYRNRKIALGLLLASTALVPLTSTSAIAQQSGSTPSAQSTDKNVETVVVTARHRQEQLKDVPVAVTAFSAEKLEADGAKDITQLTRSTPNLTLQVARGSSSTLNAFIRGIGQGDPLWGFEPGVGLYVDDVYYARPQGAILDIYNVDHVEVLRGPQGSLYGRNTIGGAVKFVTAPLPNTLAFTAKAQGGSYGEGDVYLTASTPITDKLSIGGGFEHLMHGGWGKNLLTGAANGEQNVTAGRLTVEFRPSDQLFFRLSGDDYVDNSNQRVGHRVTPGLHGNAPVTSNVFDNYSGMSPKNYVNNFGYSLLSEWTPSEEWTVKSITAYRAGSTDANIDFAATPGPELQVPGRYRDHQISEELQGLYEGRKLKGVFGLYYLDQLAAGGADTVLGNAGLTLYFGGYSQTHALAAYTDLSYDITDRLQISAGGRYNDDIRAAYVHRAFYIGLGSPFFGHPTTLLQVRTDYSNKKNFKKFTPRLSMSYKLTDDVSAYVSYSEGYKSGGFDMRGDAYLSPQTSQGYGPENVRSYEIGLKGSFFDQRLMLNLAAFLAPYKDMQVTIQTPATPPAVGIASVVLNAANSKIEGFELEGHAVLTGPLSANFSVGLADANFVHTPTLAANSVLNFALTPKWTGNFQLDYLTPTTVFGGYVDVNASASYRSKTYVFTAPLPMLDQPGYTLLEANIDWQAANSGWNVGLHGKNLADTRYRIAAYNFPGGLYGDAETAFYGDPRTILVSVQYKY